jgi:CrcB protein
VSGTAGRLGAEAALVGAVALGGFTGTLLRYGLGRAVPEAGFPWTTLGINVAGSLVLGLLTGWWAGRPGFPAWLRSGLGPGLLGSFTTFSAVAVFSASAGASGAGTAWTATTWTVAAYLLLGLVLGLSAAAAGLAGGRALGRSARRRAGAAR